MLIYLHYSQELTVAQNISCVEVRVRFGKYKVYRRTCPLASSPQILVIHFHHDQTAAPILWVNGSDFLINSMAEQTFGRQVNISLP